MREKKSKSLFGVDTSAYIGIFLCHYLKNKQQNEII